MRTMLKKAAALLLTLGLVLLGGVPALAAEASWNEAEAGVMAEWTDFAAKGKYKVQLYKGSIYSSYGETIRNNRVGSPVQTSKTHYNFLNRIAGEGAGTYRFLVWDASDASVSLASDEIQITYELLDGLKNQVSGALGWQLKDGKWYYYDEEGLKVTGWLAVDGRWYYLDPDGVCLLDTVTPDGYRVDASGAWDGQPPVR